MTNAIEKTHKVGNTCSLDFTIENYGYELRVLTNVKHCSKEFSKILIFELLSFTMKIYDTIN